MEQDMYWSEVRPGVCGRCDQPRNRTVRLTNGTCVCEDCFYRERDQPKGGPGVPRERTEYEEKAVVVPDVSQDAVACNLPDGVSLPYAVDGAPRAAQIDVDYLTPLERFIRRSRVKPTEDQIAHALEKVDALRQHLRVRCAQLERERDEARAIVAKVNNEVFGSDGYFVTPSCVEAIGQLKAHSNRRYADITALQGSWHRLREALTRLHARIANGHVQSIGSIDNVRMVQFNADELAQLAALLTDAAPEA